MVRGDMRGSYYHWGLCRCPECGPPPETMLVPESCSATRTILIWVACAATRTQVTGDGHVWVCDPAAAGFCDYPWLVLAQWAIGTTHVGIWSLCWDSPTLCWPWDRWLCPSVDMMAGKLALPLREELPPSSWPCPPLRKEDPSLRHGLATHQRQK